MTTDTSPAAAGGMLSRRQFLSKAPPLAVAATVLVGPAAIDAVAAEPEATRAWASVLATLDGLVPPGARIAIFGSAKHCRAEFSQMFSEPLHPAMPGKMIDVEWITGSYRLTENGWESEGIYEGRFE